MGKSVTAQALASEGLTGPGLPRGPLDPAAVTLPLNAGASARRTPGAVKTAPVKAPSVKTGGIKTAGLSSTARKAPATPAGDAPPGRAPRAAAAKARAARSSAGLATANPGPSPADQARLERRRIAEQSDVLVSAVISTYLLTHLHHVLQRAEFGAQQEGRAALAANYAQLRKVLCLDARTMEDASASGQPEDAPQAA